MAEYFADGHLRFLEGAWRDDNGDVVDVALVMHGRWEKTEDDFYMGLTIFKCSVCREEWVFEDMLDIEGLNYHYCPNCGAKMEGE